MYATQLQQAFRVEFKVSDGPCPEFANFMTVFGYGPTIREAATTAATKLPADFVRRMAGGFGFESMVIVPVLATSVGGLMLYTAGDCPGDPQVYMSQEVRQEVSAGVRAEPRVAHFQLVGTRAKRLEARRQARHIAERAARPKPTRWARAKAWLRGLVPG